jgi:integrase
MPRQARKVVTVEHGIQRIESAGGERFRVQLGGRGQRRSKVFSTYAEAKAAKTQWLAEGFPAAAAKDTPPPPDEPATTVVDALRVYAADLVGRDKSPARVEQLIPVLQRDYPELADAHLDAVTEQDFYRFRQHRERRKRKANTILRDMTALRSAIRCVRKDFHLPKAVFPAGDHTRVRFLSPADERRAMVALAEPFRTMVRLSVLLLTRLSDFRLLARDAVKLDEGVVFIPKTKNGEPRAVALGTEAATLLRAQLARHEGALLFPAPHGGPYSRVHVSRVWRRAIRSTGRRDFTYHDLKHHGAMHALSDGASFPELQQIGGWKDPKMVARYAQVRAGRWREIQDNMTAGRTRGRNARGR